MTLNQLLSLAGCDRALSPDVEVRAVTEDSRRAGPGTLFAAVPGEHADGHDFAHQAVAAGAVAVMGNRPNIADWSGVPYIFAPHPRRAAGIAAHALAGNPSQAMTVVGVTGTNGKSSTVAMVQHILSACGHPAACFGTLGYAIGGEVLQARHTTPFGEDLAAMFQRARAAGHTHVVMEVSSHALDQERVAGIDFDVGAFTNLTQDHLDYHKDMESYRNAKLKLFEGLEGPGKFSVVNRDDPSANAFAAASRVPCHTYGVLGTPASLPASIRKSAGKEAGVSSSDCRGEAIRTEVNRTCFQALTPWGSAEIEMRLVGMHNVSNALCALAICGGLGIAVPDIAAAMETLSNVPGRFEAVDAGQDFQVIVDYAHTEDGLRNVLRAARTICGGRVLLVFGCGGDRDRTKRPKMAAAAAELADFSIITSDNPRTESPERILLDIESGMQFAGIKKSDNYEVITDRASAIRYGIEMARAGDLVLIAGKGHEDYQIVGTERIPFDDREVALGILKGL